jgi:predicted GNAT family N-acyltransferase
VSYHIKYQINYHLKQPQKKSEFKQYYHLRWLLLRAPWNQPEGSEVDNIENQCFHIMAIDDKDDIIGVARLQFNTVTEAQIRYMAASEAHQRHGIGHELVNTLEQHAIKSQHKKIVLDAREPAVPFYEKLGYEVIEKSYLLFDEIQHFRMTKEL